ncbi:BrxE family protein [Candidatus Poriferisodalis sp.]|uniref:BrxE family protein n=1 Tax=Candidatus Poriferisodalis sp. TaxID=3101277 RepID=UPI003B02B1D0
MNAENSTDELERIIRTVVFVARLGEVDCRGWWGTHSFGAAGRVVLRRRLPRTWRMAALELDIAAAANRHDDVINRPNAVHLFSDNWPARRWTSAWIAGQKTAAQPDALFEHLETVATDRLIENLGGPQRRPSTADRAVRVGSISAGDIDSIAATSVAIERLARSYCGMDETFVVPYLEVTK